MKRILLCSLIFVLIGLTPALEASAQAAGPVYIVQQGDYLSTIAAQFGVGLQALLDANGLDNSSLIHPGQRLFIPGFEGITGVITTQSVALGETLPVLALRTGLPQDSLLRLNHITSPERVYAGEALVVTKPEEGSPARAQWGFGHAVIAQADLPVVALAAMSGQNPWEVQSQNDLSSSADAVPGQTIFLASATGDAPLRAWPDPIKTIAFRQFPLVQGSTSEITMTADGVTVADGMLGVKPLQLRPNGNGLVALQGIDVQAQPGTVPFRLQAALANGKVAIFEQDVVLVKGDFRNILAQLLVPSETLDQTAIDAENATVAGIVAPFTEPALWSGAFTPPTSRGISSYFGDRRTYNGGALTSVHHGVDYYGLKGEPILAPGAGKVAYTGLMTVCGNATIIDHGWGVYSRFCHQSKFEVAVGDVVAQGQEIGKIGMTGRADGPHLHWELWIGGVNVDPEVWIQTAFP
jgi:murein DD-endopeptidase MepM/ murein hydrolase activator NlpD